NKANINGETSIDLSQHDISSLQNTDEVSLARSIHFLSLTIKRSMSSGEDSSIKPISTEKRP
ncbi:hypothetical protein BOQ60_26400, partial [Chryseobacterium sp. CH1]